MYVGFPKAPVNQWLLVKFEDFGIFLFWKINLDQAIGIHQNSLYRKGLNVLQIGGLEDISEVFVILRLKPCRMFIYTERILDSDIFVPKRR